MMITLDTQNNRKSIIEISFGIKQMLNYETTIEIIYTQII